MADRDGPIRIDQSDGRLCLIRCRQPARQLYAPAASDRLALVQSAKRPAARQRRRPDAEIGGGEVSFRSLPLGSVYSITSSARASKAGGTSRASILAACMLMTSSNLVDCRNGRSEGFAPFRMQLHWLPICRNVSARLVP